MESANKPPAKSPPKAPSPPGANKWVKAPPNPSLLDKLLAPGSTRRKLAIPVIAGVIVLAILIKAGLTAVTEKIESSRRAEAEAVRVQTTGVLVVRSNVPEATVEAVRVAPEAGATTAAPLQAPLGQALANLVPGKYAINLRAAGWPDARGEVEVPAGQRTEATVNFAAGSLHVDSSPAGATVKWNGTLLGKTPLVVPLLPPGDIELSIQYSNWPAVPLPATVLANAESSAAIRLPHGRLTVDSFPAGAIVVLDGKSYRQTPLFFDPIAAGPKKLTLQAKDFPPLEVSVDVVDGEETRIRPLLGTGFAQLDPPALLRDVWVVDDKRAGAPAFNSISNLNRPRNDVVRNVHRQVLYDNWLRKTYRFAGVVHSFDAATHTVEFQTQRSEPAPYRVTARLPDLSSPPVKGAALSVYGRLAEVLESAWPLRVVTLELADAQVLPEP